MRRECKQALPARRLPVRRRRVSGAILRGAERSLSLPAEHTRPHLRPVSCQREMHLGLLHLLFSGTVSSATTRMGTSSAGLLPHQPRAWRRCPLASPSRQPGR